MFKLKLTGLIVTAGLLAANVATAHAATFTGHDECHIAVPQTTPETFYVGNVVEIFEGNTERLICTAHLSLGPGVDQVTFIDKSAPGITCTDILSPGGSAVERCVETF